MNTRPVLYRYFVDKGNQISLQASILNNLSLGCHRLMGLKWTKIPSQQTTGSSTGTTPGKRRDRLLLLYDYLDQLGLSEEVEQITYHGSTYRLSARQKQLRATQQRG